MATTRIMPLHVGKGRTESRAISDIIDYVANPKKTDNGRLITGYACDSRTADAEFLLAKRQYIAARRTINYISVCLYCFNPDILFLGSRHGVISACGFSRSGTGISYSFGSGSCYNIRCCSVAWRTIASVKSCKA